MIYGFMNTHTATQVTRVKTASESVTTMTSAQVPNEPYKHNTNTLVPRSYRYNR